jgi:membrane-bound lytic murein transglycosylase D
MQIVSRILALALVLVACGLPGRAAVFTGGDPAGKARSYSQMSDADRLAYVATRAEAIATLLASNGERPVAVSPEGVRAIKERLDRLAARAGSQANVPGRDDLATVVARAAKAAPVITSAFESAGLPPVYGLYIAFIESEYNDCLTSRLGSRGVFQFLPSTGEKYGLAPDDFCDLEKSAAAASRYIADRRAEFAGEKAQALFVLLSYNSGSKYIKTELLPAIEASGDDSAATFWSMTADPVRYPLSKYFQDEGNSYVPLFFAAAIVGENPADFGLGTKPLSVVGSR